MDYQKKAVNAPERLIDGNELMEWLKGKIRECVVLNAHAEAATTEEIIRYVKHMPTIDAVPVVHGRWVSKSEEGIYGPTYCSICDFELRIDDMPYCPMCGAKMDEDGEKGEK